LQSLRQCAAEPLNAEDAHLLGALWESAGLGPGFSMLSRRWMELGFQSSRPCDDFRGVGLLGLRQLLHFAQAKNGGLAMLHEWNRSPPIAGSQFRSACKQHANVASFPVAAASLNVTHMLVTHLQLREAPGGGQTATPPCSHAVLQRFLRLQHHTLLLTGEGSPPLAGALDLIHAELLRWLAARWRSMQEDGPLSPMHFPLALRAMQQHCIRTLERAEAPWDLSQLLISLRTGGPLGRNAMDTQSSERCNCRLLPALVLALRAVIPPSASA